MSLYSIGVVSICSLILLIIGVVLNNLSIPKYASGSMIFCGTMGLVISIILIMQKYYKYIWF